jgi:hypothetical protein
MKNFVTYSNLKGEVVPFKKTCPTSGTTQVFEPSPSTDFWVHGRVVDSELSTELEFEKFFTTQKDAEKYFDKMKDKYPMSEVIIQSRTFQEIKIFA